MYFFSPSDELTDGIEIMNWTLNLDSEEGKGLTYSVWDFAGQVVYYNTHQVSQCHGLSWCVI